MPEAAMAYLQHLDMMVHCHCDKIHRVIRDLKLSNMCDPRFAEAILATTYVFSINYKPAGSGAPGDEGLDALNAFVNTFAMQETNNTTMNKIFVFTCYWIFLHDCIWVLTCVCLSVTVALDLTSRTVHPFLSTSSSLRWT